MRNLICVMLVVFLPLTLASQTQKRFKVCVNVYGDDAQITNTLESNLKREFRLLGDVDIVDFDENWHFVYSTSYLEAKFKDGRKRGYVAIASVWYERVPDSYFKVDRLAQLKGQPVYSSRSPGAALYDTDILDKHCVWTVGNVDKVYLTPVRKLLR
ncbi:hypothetical protein J5I95_07500 [Candidatus Poribacteria bacterium]|nr:hypothetical protein [Candidatus Poribacteria bacterium]